MTQVTAQPVARVRTRDFSPLPTGCAEICFCGSIDEAGGMAWGYSVNLNGTLASGGGSLPPRPANDLPSAYLCGLGSGLKLLAGMVTESARTGGYRGVLLACDDAAVTDALWDFRLFDDLSPACRQLAARVAVLLKALGGTAAAELRESGCIGLARMKAAQAAGGMA